MVQRLKTSNSLRVSNKRTKKLLPRRTKKIQRGGMKGRKTAKKMGKKALGLPGRFIGKTRRVLSKGTTLTARGLGKLSLYCKNRQICFK